MNMRPEGIFLLYRKDYATLNLSYFNMLSKIKCNEQYIRFVINEPIYMIDAYRQENILCYKLIKNKSF